MEEGHGMRWRGGSGGGGEEGGGRQAHLDMHDHILSPPVITAIPVKMEKRAINRRNSKTT